MANDIKAMTDTLDKDKEEFLNCVENAINAHISTKSWQGYLTIVQRYDDGRIRSTLEPKVSESYWNRMVAFLRGKRYNGWQLDSKLTDGVVDVVTKKFGEFYQDHAKDLSGPLTQRLLKDRVFSKQLANNIIEAAKGPLPDAIKKELSSRIVDVLEHTDIGGHIMNVAVVRITAAINTVIAYAVSSSVVTIMLQHMAVFLKGAIVKVLATTAFKTMIVSVIKVIAKTKIIAFLVVIFGSLLGSVPLWAVIAPLLLAFIAYQVASLPDNLRALSKP